MGWGLVPCCLFLVPRSLPLTPSRAGAYPRLGIERGSVLDFGLIGLTQSGKTTVFDALTGGHVPTGTYEAGGPHLGVVKIPDQRLDHLAERFRRRPPTPMLASWTFPAPSSPAASGVVAPPLGP